LRDRLALFEGHRDRHLLHALPDQLCGLENHLGPLCRRCARPDPKPILGRCKGVVEVCACRMRNRAEYGFVGRIDDGRATGAPPFAADVKFQFGLLDHSASSWKPGVVGLAVSIWI
jgi:hypothetical protein